MPAEYVVVVESGHGAVPVGADHAVLAGFEDRGFDVAGVEVFDVDDRAEDARRRAVLYVESDVVAFGYGIVAVFSVGLCFGRGRLGSFGHATLQVM